jgi:2-C-methyl-D-erythritol 2,4-cyclodiphosphate synthase
VTADPGLRVGTGIDVHPFAPGRALVIGGVPIPHGRGLAGHSDADVLLHAVCDALLGAAALGDIGRHFPDSDPSLRGISSLELLRRTAALLAGAGFDPVQVDACVLAEEPRLAPHYQAMREAIAGALGIPADRVGVKATTTEGLGFTGRREGIAAQAVCLIARRGPAAGAP